MGLAALRAGRELTQLAIDRQLTLIAFEAMNHWRRDGSFGLHVFHKNNELAGYCSVLHALQLIGSTGDYGRRLRAVVIGFGATARGAVTALNAHGDPRRRRPHRRAVVSAVGSPIHSATMVHFDHDANNPGDLRRSHAITGHGRVPLAGFLAEHDIVVNCVLQDTDAPLTFLIEDDLAAFAPGSLIVDVSCDEGMGFSWARPTTFTEPTFTVGDDITYYAVDHSPSYLWNSATWEISEALLPYLRPVLSGHVRMGRTRNRPARRRDPRRHDPEPGDPVLPAPRTGLPAPAPLTAERPVGRGLGGRGSAGTGASGGGRCCCPGGARPGHRRTASSRATAPSMPVPGWQPTYSKYCSSAAATVTSW